MTAPKRFPDRDHIAAVRAEAEPLEEGAEAGTTRRIAGRAMARVTGFRSGPDSQGTAQAPSLISQCDQSS